MFNAKAERCYKEDVHSKLKKLQLKQLKLTKMNTQQSNLLQVSSKTETVTASTVYSVNQNGVLNQNKTFCAADLWNIQRQGRTMLQRRRSL